MLHVADKFDMARKLAMSVGNAVGMRVSEWVDDTRCASYWPELFGQGGVTARARCAVRILLSWKFK